MAFLFTKGRGEGEPWVAGRMELAESSHVGSVSVCSVGCVWMCVNVNVCDGNGRMLWVWWLLWLWLWLKRGRGSGCYCIPDEPPSKVIDAESIRMMP